jgi:hypothetical protein
VSYARLGPDSDVYVFASDSGLHCHWCCRGLGDAKSLGVVAMVRHLREHRTAGDKVPSGTCREIVKDAILTNMRLRTWHMEGLFVASALVGALFAFGRAGDWREWVAALGVQFGFHHASVADRLREAEEGRTTSSRRWNTLGEACAGLDGRCGFAYPHEGDCALDANSEGHHVECVAWLQRYWVLKEVAWVAYFLATGAVSALVGCAVFLAHPFWRRWYRARKPRSSS